MDPECGIADHLCVHDQIMFLHITYRSRHCWTGVALQGAGCSCDTEFLRNSQLSDARFWCTEMAIYNYDGDHHSILHFFDILYSIPLYCTSCKPCRIYTCANRVVIPRSKKTGFSRTHPVLLLKHVSSQPIKHSSIHSAFNLAPISVHWFRAAATHAVPGTPQRFSPAICSSFLICLSLEYA